MIDTFQLQLKNWESEFFSKTIYSLNISDDFTQFDELKKHLETSTFDIIEVNLNTRDIGKCQYFEDLGFRLVDSRMIFITQFENQPENFSKQKIPKDLNIRFYGQNDFEQVIELTDKYLAESKTFFSRYQNTNYFEKEDARKYYRAWIKHSINDPQSLISVIETKESEVVGFFIYRKNGEKDGLNIYKGILCTVNERFRGQKLHLALQDFLFKNFKDDVFLIDNTTQISNLPIVKNHIRVGRRLNEIYLTFLLKKSDLNS